MMFPPLWLMTAPVVATMDTAPLRLFREDTPPPAAEPLINTMLPSYATETVPSPLRLAVGIAVEPLTLTTLPPPAMRA